MPRGERATATSSAPAVDIGLARLAFALLMAFWLAYPIFQHGRYAQDAIPLVAAGELVRSHPADVYVGPDGGLFETKPAFHEASCAYYDTRDDCDRYAVAFVSPPTAIPLVLVLGHMHDAAFPFLRELGAITLVGAMVLLWRRLVAATPRAAMPLTAAAFLLTPLMTAPLGLGQTSPLLFLSAAIPITLATRQRRWTAAFAVVTGAVIALKAFPAALLAVPALRRRWPAVAGPLAVVAALSVIALLVAKPRLWSDFLVSSGPLTREALDNPYSSSLESAVGQLGLHAAAVVWALRIALAVPIVWLLARLRDVDVQWGCAWAAMLVLFPQVWGHYSFVLVAAVVAVLVARPDRERFLWALPAVAALTVPVGVLGSTGRGSPLVQLLCNVVGVAIVLVLAPRTEDVQATATAPVAA